jgi:hypothetical protein
MSLVARMMAAARHTDHSWRNIALTLITHNDQNESKQLCMAELENYTFLTSEMAVARPTVYAGLKRQSLGGISNVHQNRIPSPHGCFGRTKERGSYRRAETGVKRFGGICVCDVEMYTLRVVNVLDWDSC